jgi:short-subunit dehydrogenase
MKAVIVGATSGMGREVARQLAERGDALFLLGRDGEELERSAADLLARGAPAPVEHARCDLRDPESFEAALDAADEALGAFDTVVITAGQFGTQGKLEEDQRFLGELLTTNFSGTILLCEAVRRRLGTRGGGTLCVFSSVAGDRGRKPVVLYGATKAGLSHYLEGLDHRYRADGLTTITVKPGFVRTPMTAGLPEPPFAGDADAVARSVVRALDRGTPVVYAPSIWRWIMTVIRLLPRAVMRRVGF